MSVTRLANLYQQRYAGKSPYFSQVQINSRWRNGLKILFQCKII